jgi:transposase
LKSEKDAYYDKAMKMLSKLPDVTRDSVRLDRYYLYSSPSYVDSFDRSTKVFVIPKKNATLNGSWKWKETMIEFVKKNTMNYLEQYHLLRSNSE